MAEKVAAGPDLVALVASLADNKQFLGRRYAEWCTAAPTLESAVAAAAMAQDEIGHARSLYPLLKDLVGTSEETEAESRTQFVNVAFLSRPFAGWTDFVAANFLFDTAMTMMFQAARESTFSPLAQRARRILEEEHLHWLHGEGWVRRLPQRGEAVREALNRSLAAVGPESADWLGIATQELVSEGVLNTDAEGLRQVFRQRVNPVLSECGISEI